VATASEPTATKAEKRASFNVERAMFFFIFLSLLVGVSELNGYRVADFRAR
jgi:hypothetical protein